jgi:hypothetical protein
VRRPWTLRGALSSIAHVLKHISLTASAPRLVHDHLTALFSPENSELR